MVVYSIWNLYLVYKKINTWKLKVVYKNYPVILYLVLKRLKSLAEKAQNVWTTLYK